MKRVVLCAALLAFSGLSYAAVYKWVDVQGKTQYGDRPPDGVKAELVEGLGIRTPSSYNTRSSAPTRTAGTSSTPGTCDHYYPLGKAENLLPQLFQALAGRISRGQLTS